MYTDWKSDDDDVAVAQEEAKAKQGGKVLSDVQELMCNTARGGPGRREREG